MNHVTTFDGTNFDFVGECSYSLVEPIGSDKGVWAIFVKYSNCEQHVKKLCQKSVEVRIGSDYFAFGKEFLTTFNNQIVSHFPHREGKKKKLEMKVCIKSLHSINKLNFDIYNKSTHYLLQ